MIARSKSIKAISKITDVQPIGGGTVRVIVKNHADLKGAHSENGKLSNMVLEEIDEDTWSKEESGHWQVTHTNALHESVIVDDKIMTDW